MTKALRQRRTGMCSYAMNACCFPLSSRRVASRRVAFTPLGGAWSAASSQSARRCSSSLSLSLSLSLTLTQPLESRRRSASAENEDGEDGCYTVSSRVFSPVLWSQDPAHRRYEQLSLSLSVCVCVCVCSRARSSGAREGLLFV